MATTEIEGRQVDVEVSGDGEAVVFLHARPFVSWYGPLLGRLGGYSTVVYRRAVDDRTSFGIEDDAALVEALLPQLDIERPHVVGHSYGGIVALELARRRRVGLRSLALLEPATTGLLDPAEARVRTAPLLELVREQGAHAAMEVFLDTVCGASGRARLDELLADAAADGREHAAAFFAAELPAVIDWRFRPEDATSIDLPVLNVSGSTSEPRFAESAEIIAAWFPAARHVTIPGATHLLMADAPVETAGHLRSFWAGG